MCRLPVITLLLQVYFGGFLWKGQLPNMLSIVATTRLTYLLLCTLQLSTELTQTLEANNVRVITERLSLEAGVDNPAIVVQQLNVRDIISG